MAITSATLAAVGSWISMVAASREPLRESSAPAMAEDDAPVPRAYQPYSV